MGLKELVVVCPGGAVTGGPEALHQLVSMANKIQPESASILYYPFESRSVTPDEYKQYGCPVIKRGEVPVDALVVLPEIWPDMAYTFENKCALWWLSVDNFGTHGQKDLSRIVLNLCQSYYAFEHVKRHKCLMLTDYVCLPDVETQVRKPVVAVNPAKDAGMLQSFKAMCVFPIVELRGLDRIGVAKTLYSSSVYVDFGRHPGRDRLPREAAYAGCTVFSTRLGAARFQEDMPLEERFKFDTVNEVLTEVSKVMTASKRPSQNEYRGWVAGAQAVFQEEVAQLLKWHQSIE